jgi:hypothetical protein
MDITIIHLNKDIGRIHYINYITSLFTNANIYLSDSCHDIDGNIKEPESPTKKISKAHYDVINKSTVDYHLIFEDDVILHNDFNKLMPLVNTFIHNHDFTILYLGISDPLDYKNEFSIHILEPLQIYSGAFAYIVNNKYKKEILNEFKYLNDKEHDIYVYGKFQMKRTTYITDPPLAISNVESSNVRQIRNQSLFSSRVKWNLMNYISFIKIPLIIVTYCSESIFKRFYNLIKTWLPSIEIHILIINNSFDNLQSKHYFEKLGENFKIYNFNTFGHKKINTVIREIVLNLNSSSQIFGVINSNIGWTLNLNNNFFQSILNPDNFNVSFIETSKFYQGLCFFNKLCINKEMRIETLIENNYFYQFSHLTKIDSSKIMNLCGDDLRFDLASYLKLLDIQLYEHVRIKNINEWLILFIKWWEDYFIHSINKILKNKYVVNSNNHFSKTLIINIDDRSLFNSLEFKNLRYWTQYEKEQIIIRHGFTHLTKEFSKIITQLEELCIEHSIHAKYQELIVLCKE